MVTFSHRDPGTDETLWREAFTERMPVEFDLDADALLVVAAHPDDETLGAGGLVHRAAARGLAVEVIAVTDGEGSHPDSPTHTPAELAALRRIELRASIDELSPGATITFLGVPDGGIRDHHDAVDAAVRTGIHTLRDNARRVLVVAPWTGDGHGDHRVTGAAAARVCDSEAVPLWMYPIWLWHWGSTADVPWDDIRVIALDADAVAAKRRALAHHASQTTALSDASGDEVMLHEAMQSHFLRPFEVVIAPSGTAQPESTVRPGDAGRSLDAEWFEAFYARNDDPWGFDSRWYEERKRAVLLAGLPARRYTRALELGCSTGALTEALAGRADELVAVDIADAPLEQAAQRLAGVDGVRFVKAALPHDWPAGAFDLVVMSEIGYYWSEADLDEAIMRIEGSLTESGALVACHWRHAVAEYPLTGDAVHTALRTRSSLVRTVRHDEADFLLEVFARPPARSVAQLTGLAP